MSDSHGKMSYYPPLPADPVYDPCPAGTEGKSAGPQRSHTYTVHDEGRRRDLVLYNAGYQRCTPGHSWSSIRDHYLIHLIFEGCGTFSEAGRLYKLESGQGFLIRPGIVSSYKADLLTPWIYAWFGFAGNLADHYLESGGLSGTSPIINFEPDGALPDCVIRMNDPPPPGPAREPYLTKLLYEFFYLLASDTERHIAGRSGPGSPGSDAQPVQERYVVSAEAYIRRNYSRPISVEAVASHVGISRKYLSALFNTRRGKNPQEYLLDLRMDRAAELLAHRELPVKIVANSVGYADPLQFSRAFKRRRGVSPTEFRSIPKPDFRSSQGS